MCMVVPAKVVAVDGGNAAVSFGRTHRRVKNLCNAGLNDFVLVRGSVALEKIESERALEISRVLSRRKNPKKKNH